MRLGAMDNGQVYAFIFIVNESMQWKFVHKYTKQFVVNVLPDAHL